MHRRNILRLSNLSKSLAIVVLIGCPTFLGSAQAQYSHSFDLSSYRGNDPEARAARGFCWDTLTYGRITLTLTGARTGNAVGNFNVGTRRAAVTKE